MINESQEEQPQEITPEEPLQEQIPAVEQTQIEKKEDQLPLEQSQEEKQEPKEEPKITIDTPEFSIDIPKEIVVPVEEPEEKQDLKQPEPELEAPEEVEEPEITIPGDTEEPEPIKEEIDIDQPQEVKLELTSLETPKIEEKNKVADTNDDIEML